MHAVHNNGIECEHLTAKLHIIIERRNWGRRVRSCVPGEIVLKGGRAVIVPW